MADVFSDKELQDLAKKLKSMALKYQKGGRFGEGTPFFGNRTSFTHYPTIIRDFAFAQDTYANRDGYMGLTMMALSDAFTILAEDGELNEMHVRALGSRTTLNTLHRYYEKHNPMNNPLSGSGLKDLLTNELQLKFKAITKDEAQLKRFLDAVKN